jgi:hypothetical protein
MAQYPKQEEEITQIFKRWRAAEIGCPFSIYGGRQ